MDKHCHISPGVSGGSGGSPPRFVVVACQHMKIPADLDPTPRRIPRSAPGCHSVQVSDCTRHIPYQRLRFSASSCGSTPPPPLLSGGNNGARRKILREPGISPMITPMKSTHESVQFKHRVVRLYIAALGEM